MSELFQNKYRIPSARLQTWNYADEGMYFITICTAERHYYFGRITEKKMQLSQLGKIAETEWMKTRELRPDINLLLGEFVVMPNHIHGIIMIGANQYNDNGICRDAMHRVSMFGPQRKNLASVIRGYKSAVTTYARKNNIPFGWQPRFHDHIIRTMADYYRISNYIINNPAKWQDDEFHANDHKRLN